MSLLLKRPARFNAVSLFFSLEARDPPSPTSLRVKLRRVERLRRTEWTAVLAECQSMSILFFDFGVLLTTNGHEWLCHVKASKG